MKALLKTFAITAFALFSLSANAASWTVDPAASTIAFSGTHAGNSFKGTFQTWTADIDFDPAQLATSHVVVTIETKSAKTGNPMYDGTLTGTDWFDTDHYPKAVFKADKFTATGGNTYTAEGTLTIKDKSHPITLAFTLDIKEGTATMQAAHTLDRIAYGLGASSDPDADWVSKEIALAIKTVAHH